MMIYKSVDLNLNLSQKAKELISRIEKVGSTVTCNPSPTNTDIDYLVLVENAENEQKEIDLTNILINDGWTLTGSAVEEYTDIDCIEAGHKFYSLYKDKYNIILTPHYKLFRNFLAATSVAKKFNLLNKTDRIILYQAVLYGNPCEPDQTG